MPAIKHSKQREAIMAFLKTRYDHPTADTVYMNIRQEFPNISLGTVYRNLSLLADLGEIQKLTPGQGPDRFDANVHHHYHFICKTCGQVMDMDMENLDLEAVHDIASKKFGGHIDGHVTYFYGTCPTACKIKKRNNRSRCRSEATSRCCRNRFPVIRTRMDRLRQQQ